MRRGRGSLEVLDRVPVPDDWEEIERRAARLDAPIDLRPSISTRTQRAAAALVAVALFAGLALFGWVVFRQGEGSRIEPVRPADRGEEDRMDPAGPVPPEASPIISIEGGYLLYRGVWQEIPWELVAVEAPRPGLRCGDGPLAIAYRDPHSTDWQGCPKPHLSAEAFLGREGALVVGTLTTEVASIRAETKDGRVVEGLIVPLDRELEAGFNAFVVEIPSPHPGSLVARDAQGLVLQEWELRPVGEIPSS